MYILFSEAVAGTWLGYDALHEEEHEHNGSLAFHHHIEGNEQNTV